MSNPAPVPALVLTGFLGAGKTTLLNKLLDKLGRDNTALIINEFGEVPIDGMLVETGNDNLLEIANGCVCCTVRGDYADALVTLAAYNKPWLVVETTGLADPAPLLSVLIKEPEIRQSFRPGAVLTVVDATNALTTLRDHEEARKQVVLADFLYVSKSELVSDPSDLALLERQLSKLNPVARRLDAENFEPLIETLKRGAPPSANTLHAATVDDHHDHDHKHGHGHEHDHSHEHGHLQGWETLVLEHDAPLPRSAISMFCDLITSGYPDKVLRMKGTVLLEDSHDTPVILQAVGPGYDLSHRLERWGKLAQKTRIVVIYKGLESRFLTKLFDGFTNRASVDTPDRTALESNPLAVPGMKM